MVSAVMANVTAPFDGFDEVHQRVILKRLRIVVRLVNQKLAPSQGRHDTQHSDM